MVKVETERKGRIYMVRINRPAARNAVDAETRQCVTDLIQKIKAQGKTVIVATHYYDQEEARYDSAIYLKDGQQITGAKQQTRNACGGHNHG